MSEDTPNTVALVIPAGESEAPAVDLGLFRAHRLEFPAEWDAASVTFQVSYDGTVYVDLFTETAEYVVTAAAAGRAVLLDQEAFYGIRRLILRSGTAETPVLQTAQRTVRLVKAPE